MNGGGGGGGADYYFDRDEFARELEAIDGAFSDEEDESDDGLPHKASVVGEVIQVGPGRVLRDGSRAPQPCAVGDTVRFQDLDVTECDIEDEEYVLVDSQHVMMKWPGA